MLVSVSQRSLNQSRMSQPTTLANAAPQITDPTMIRIRRTGCPGADSTVSAPLSLAASLTQPRFSPAGIRLPIDTPTNSFATHPFRPGLTRAPGPLPEARLAAGRVDRTGLLGGTPCGLPASWPVDSCGSWPLTDRRTLVGVRWCRRGVESLLSEFSRRDKACDWAGYCHLLPSSSIRSARNLRSGSVGVSSRASVYSVCASSWRPRRRRRFARVEWK